MSNSLMELSPVPRLFCLTLLVCGAPALAQSIPADGNAPGWTAPAPYAREDQVDDGRPDDEAHRADRARTAALNHAHDRDQADYQAALVRHDRAEAAYSDARARYLDDMARWRAQTDACERGDTDGCVAPR